MAILPKCKRKSVEGEQSPLLTDFRTPPGCLSSCTRYDNMMSIVGRKGFLVQTVPELQAAIKEALQIQDGPTIINVLINPTADRKPQAFNWLTESKL